MILFLKKNGFCAFGTRFLPLCLLSINLVFFRVLCISCNCNWCPFVIVSLSLFYCFSFSTHLQNQLFCLPLDLACWEDFQEGFLFDICFSFPAIQIVFLPLLASSLISSIAFIIFIHLFEYTIRNSFYSLDILKLSFWVFCPRIDLTHSIKCQCCRTEKFGVMLSCVCMFLMLLHRDSLIWCYLLV